MKSKFLIIALLLLLSAVYWQWFIPELKVANDLPAVSDAALKSAMDFPRIWSEKGSEGLGEYTVFTLWSYPVVFISGVLANLGLSFAIVERILLLIPFLFIGSFGIWKFCQGLNLSNVPKLIATFFYLSNTYILLVIDGGQLSIALAYAWFPICFLLIENSIQKSFRQQVIIGLAISILGFFDIRFIYLLFLLVLLRFLYEFLYLDRKQWINWIYGWVKNGFIWLAVTIALNAFWLFPILKAPLAEGVYSNLTKGSFLSFITLGHAFLMTAPNWFENVFGKITPLKWEFIFIPIIIFLAPILKIKNRVVGFWLIIALVSTFLAKGSSEPLSALYPWLFDHLPLFSLFRDSSKFFFLVALSYTVLIGISINELAKKLNDYKRLKLVFYLILICYFLFLIRPIWQGKMTGTFSHPQLHLEYSQLDKILSEDKEFSRVLWIPTLKPLTNLTLQHPVVEASRLTQKRPFAIGTKGTYEFFNFLREAPYMGEIFDVAGIGYITYPPLDSRRDNTKPDNVKYYYTFLNQLSNLSWLTRASDSKIPLLKVKQHQNKLFITPNVWWVIGSDNIYSEATKSAKLALSKNALIFAQENANLGKRIDELSNVKIVLNNKELKDLAASFIDSSHLIFPAKQLDFNPDKSGWWKREAIDLIDWRQFLETKYEINNQDFDLAGGWAVAEGSLKLNIKSEKFDKDKVLLARVMESSKSGELKFYQGGKLIGQINTKVDDKPSNVRWFEVGNLVSGDEIPVTSEGGINVVNALASLDKNEWNSFEKKAQSYKDKGLIADFKEENALQKSFSVSYREVNPTKYVVDIKGLESSAFLVFSENFDNLWKIGKNSPLPVYSLLNGFEITKDGEYTIEFTAQSYVNTGLTVTGITILIMISFLLLSTKRLRSKI